MAFIEGDTTHVSGMTFMSGSTVTLTLHMFWRCDFIVSYYVRIYEL